MSLPPFDVGDRVVCVTDITPVGSHNHPAQVPVVGEHYTVSLVAFGTDAFGAFRWGVQIAELPCEFDWLYSHVRFRKLDEDAPGRTRQLKLELTPND